MILTTTSLIEGRTISEYLDVIVTEIVVSTNFINDMLGSVTDFLSGKSAGYEEELSRARQQALNDLITKAEIIEADAVLGMTFNYEAINQILLISISGTAVKLQ